MVEFIILCLVLLFTLVATISYILFWLFVIMTVFDLFCAGVEVRFKNKTTK